MVAELSYRRNVGAEFSAREDICLALSSEQLERESRTKVNIWKSKLLAKVQTIEERSKNEVMTESRASTSETKYRFLEVCTENHRMKAWKMENFGDFFLKTPGRNQNGMFPAVCVLMRLLDTGVESRSLQLLHAELYKYCRTMGANRGESDVSLRDIEFRFTRSICNQLRSLERGRTKPNLRELLLLKKFLLKTGKKEYILGGKKVLKEVQELISQEKKSVDSVAPNVSAPRLSIENYVERIRAGGDKSTYDSVGAGSSSNDQDTPPADMGPIAKEVFGEDVLVEVSGHEPIKVQAGQSIVKTPVKSVQRCDKPNIDKRMKINMLRQIIQLCDPLEANTLSKTKDMLGRIYKLNVETVFRGSLVTFRWCDKYQFETLVVLWWRRAQLTGVKKGGLRDFLMEALHNLKCNGMKIHTVKDMRENIDVLLTSVSDLMC